jgi:hypothetical protein
LVSLAAPSHVVTGRLGHLTDAEEKVLAEMMKAADQEKVVASGIQIPGEPMETLLLRFLRARDFDISKSLLMLNESLAWRLETNVHVLKANDMTGLFKVKAYPFSPPLPGRCRFRSCACFFGCLYMGFFCSIIL